ncbi:hypothetical protein BDV25DRAFT_104446 [Aspergillus avenaceus]|uniref:Xylanolytic transcriptional activator regulatory domain-containing protein n=1 Tax=Aspergillus avenaceus TaxID=36643 RepID=A0A5N6TWX1_ASPAV|nr:hypothetical protein BDV25DRAFT_104446 [Aspergillus avenaceus]
MDILLDKDAAYIAIGAAARVATSIGLQQQVKDLRLSPPEISERYIVFWCLYSFDKTLSLRLGRPPAIDDRDTEIDIPDEKQLTLENPRSITVLLSHMRLGRITSEVYSELYSARSRKYPAIKRFRTISELDRKLQDWCMSLPADIRPGSQISCSEGALRSVFTLHLEYYNCLATLHRCWAFQDPLAEYEELRNDLAHRGCGDIGDRVYSGQLICLDAARSTADLLTVLGQHGLQDSALIGLTLYHSLSAFIILFANILQNPGDSYVSKDVQLLSVIIDSLCPGLQASGAALPNLAYELLEKMRSVAVEYVARVHTNVKAAPKRPYEQTEGAVKRHPIRSAQDNHNQPPDYRHRVRW